MITITDLFCLTIESLHLSGLIFTYVWAFDLADDWRYVKEVTRIVESKGWDTVWVELEASLETRMMRNRTPHRLDVKPTKRNLEWSEQDLKASLEKHRLTSLPGEIPHARYLRLDNTNMSPQDAAQAICRHFGWSCEEMER